MDKSKMLNPLISNDLGVFFLCAEKMLFVRIVLAMVGVAQG